MIIGWMRFWKFPRPMGQYCSYLLSKQALATHEENITKYHEWRDTPDCTYMWNLKSLLALEQQWHFKEIMKRHFSSSDSDQYHEIMNMQRVRREDILENLLKIHARRHGKNSYFQENYGNNGKVAKPRTWAKCYNYTHPGTSMLSEERTWLWNPICKIYQIFLF